ncbi:MAG: site-specific integrase [Ruminococcus sp.]|nr:site-specific integrase [Ruminococcus sp.]
MPIYKSGTKKKDGKQKYLVRVNYVDSLGKKRQYTRVAYGLEEAKRVEMELNYQKNEPTSKKLTLSELVDKYLESHKYEVRESSLDTTQRMLKHHVLTDKYKNIKIDKLTVPVLQQWKDEINNTDLSIVSKQHVFGEFRALLNWAVKTELLPKNNLLKVGNFKAPLERKKEMLFYTVDEFSKYIAVAKQKAEENLANNNYTGYGIYTFFMIAFFTGMRKGEINALTWDDIDANIIHITKSVTQKIGGGDKITAPKNASSIRDIEIPYPLMDALNEQKERCKCQPNFSEDWYICGGVRPLRDTPLTVANTKIAEGAGVKHIRIHDFRHSHASLLANEGINIQEVARRLGHSKIEMTWNRYSHLYPRESERALQVLNKIEVK